MSVSTTTNKIAYTLSSGTQTLAVPFYFLANADLRVLLTKAATGGVTLLALTTSYTASGAGTEAGGSITLTGATVSGITPASGDTVTIKRVPAQNQLVDYVNNDAFPASTHERALDKLTMQVQDVQEQVARSLRFGESELLDGTLNLADRKGKYLYFDSATGAIDFANIDAAAAAEAVDAAESAAASAAAAAADAALAASFQPRIEVSSISALRALGVGAISNGWNAAVGGYYSSGDGGGGLFYYDSTSVVADDAGAVLAPNTGSGRWFRLVGDSRTANVRMWGAKGDAVANDTAAFQAAINWCEINRVRLHVPSGIYKITSITISSCDLEGVAPDRQTLKGSIIWHDPTATNDLIVIRTVDYDAGRNKARISNLSLIGNRESNRKASTTTAITAVASRTAFTVSSAFAATFWTWSPSADQPFYGWCWFYNANGEYLGMGMVKTVNTSTGAITIETGTDIYATRAAAGSILEVGVLVSFTPRVSETSGTYGAQNYQDSGKAGYCAIDVRDAQWFSVFYNIEIESFHCGIRRTFQGAIHSDLIGIRRCNIGISVSSWGGDSIESRIYVQGNYARDYEAFTSGNQSVVFARRAATALVPDTNTDLRNGLGLYIGNGGGDYYTHLIVDGCTYGIYAKDAHSTFGYLWLDRVKHTAIGGFGYKLAASQSEIRCQSATTNTQTAVIGESATLQFGLLRSSVFTAKKFLNLFSPAGGSVFKVSALENGRFTGDEGFTNLTGTTRVFVEQMTSAGFTRATRVQFGRQLSTLVSGEVPEIPTAFDGLACVTHAGLTGANANCLVFSIGGGASQIAGRLNGTAISPTALLNTQEIGNYSYGGHDGNAFAQVIRLRAVTTENWSSTARGTKLQIEATKATTATRVVVAEVDAETSSTQTGLLLLLDGSVKRVVAGAADSGGSGYRLLRVAN
jgi:hypothetical protein